MPLCSKPILLALNACEGVIQLLLARVGSNNTPSEHEIKGTPSKCEMKKNAQGCERKEAPTEQSNLCPHAQKSGALNAQTIQDLEFLAFESVVAPAQGVEVMMPTLQSMCAKHHIDAKQIHYIACVRGPGSFTGVRLGLSTSAGLARACNALQGGIDYLWLLALQGSILLQGNTPTTKSKTCSPPQGTTNLPAFAASKTDSLHIMAVTHARRDLVHAQHFVVSTPIHERTWQKDILQNLAPQSAILVLSPHELAEHIKAEGYTQKNPLVLLGSGLSKNHTAFAQLFAQQTFAPIILDAAHNVPTAETLLHAASVLTYSRQDISPLYARLSEAEENITSIAETLHINPEEAATTLKKLRQG